MVTASLNAPRRPWLLPAVVAALAFLLVVCAIDPAGNYPGMPQGPGLTTDEMFNVEEGVRLTRTLPELVIGRLTLREVFGDADRTHRVRLYDPRAAAAEIGYHNPDHPPLGRLAIGLGHNVTRRLFPPRVDVDDAPQPSQPPAGGTPAAQSPADQAPQHVVTACARAAPALAFAALVFLVGWSATLWYGRAAGLTASVALVLMPRLFGHAHLAALETFINLTWCAAALSVAHLWHGESAPKWKTACLTGGLFGLALLTKIQAILLPLPIVVWAVWHWRWRALPPLAVWGVTGFVVFFVGWPWLWLSPVEHLLEYFARTTARTTLYAFYLGERYADVDVPWHYPAVMFLTTVPVGLHLLGFIGLGSSRETRAESQAPKPTGRVPWGEGRPLRLWLSALGSRLLTLRSWLSTLDAVSQPREQLLLACLLFPLIVFALPGVAVYDGARLFLVVFPLWAIFIGRGAAVALAWLRRKLPPRAAVAAFAVFIALQGFGLWAVHPCYLSYYNLLVGGLPGAERLGMELNYWGDGLTRRLLEETADLVPPGSTLALFPVPHQFVIDDLERQSPILRQKPPVASKKRQIRPWQESATTRPPYVLLYRRRADPPGTPMFDHPPANARRIAVVERQGVPLAALYAFPSSSP